MSETRVVHVNDHVPGAVYIGRADPAVLLLALWLGVGTLSRGRADRSVLRGLREPAADAAPRLAARGTEAAMSVYVDELKTFETVRGQAARYGKTWCHMMADSHDELMAFAERLGLRPQWLQHAGRPTEHFDLLPSKRAVAVRLGAKEVTWREMAMRTRGKAA